MIYQDLSIFPNLTVAENIAFDQHVDSAVKGVNWSRMYKKAQEVLDRMKIQLDLDVLVELCDRVLVLCGGKVSGVVDGRTATKEELGLYMTRVGGGKEGAE